MSEPTLGVLILSCCFLVANRFAAEPAIVFGITNPALLKKRLLSPTNSARALAFQFLLRPQSARDGAGIQLQRRREFARHGVQYAPWNLSSLGLVVLRRLNICRSKPGMHPTRSIYRCRGGTAYFVRDAHFETKSAARAILQLKGDAGIANPQAFDIAGRRYWTIYSIAFSSD